MVYGTAVTSSTSNAVTSTLSLSQAATLTFAQSTPVTGVIAAFAANPAATASPSALTVGTPTVTSAAKFSDNADSTHFIYDTQTYNPNGTVTETTYTAYDSAGKTEAQGGAITAFTTAGGVAGFNVSSQTYTPVGAKAAGLLSQNGTDLTQLGSGTETIISEGTASNALTAVNSALTAVTNYAATIGATQDRMTAASTFNTALDTNLQSGISGLVDANMNTASTQLQALQTQEQLGIQSLSIANQGAQLILKLFS